MYGRNPEAIIYHAYSRGQQIVYIKDFSNRVSTTGHQIVNALLPALSSLINHIDLDDDAMPKNTTFSFDISIPRDTVNYSGEAVSIDLTQLA